jgi:hypothetical protein
MGQQGRKVRKEGLDLTIYPPSNHGYSVFINFLYLSKDFFRASNVASDMGARNEMSLALEKMLIPATGRPERKIEEAESRLEISVVFTSVESTLSALKAAGVLADRLSAHITLVVPQIVPYPLPLTSPPVQPDFNDRRFRVIAGQSHVETAVRVYLCRDRMETLKAVLKPHSLIVIGGRQRWWRRTSEELLAQNLRRSGHEVIFTETE